MLRGGRKRTLSGTTITVGRPTFSRLLSFRGAQSSAASRSRAVNGAMIRFSFQRPLSGLLRMSTTLFIIESTKRENKKQSILTYQPKILTMVTCKAMLMLMAMTTLLLMMGRITHAAI